MAGEDPAKQEQDDSEAEFVEVDPTGRYGRYQEVLGKGAFKTVYRAFDELEGIEVAWNQVKMADLLRNSDDLERLYSEVHLLQTLKHKNIIKFYNSWIDTRQGNINFITEIFTSGTLRQYRKKHKHVDTRALKNWSRQILRGLHYLHSHDPPVIHRDLKCDNIFVNGNQGEVKIGDLGLAAILRHAQSAHSVIGTPEFMAPELYEEDYNELVDIYAFGMCLLELVTFEYPYMECANAAQIYKKVTAGIKPASLEKVHDPEVRRFIEKCIANASERLPARDLLMDPFLRSDVEEEIIERFSDLDFNHSDKNGCQSGNTSSHVNANADFSTGSRDFTVQGQMKDTNTIFLKLRITDSTGDGRNIHFPFDIEADTSISVASEMVAELDLTDQDVTAIAAMIDAEIQSHVPEWIPGETFHEGHDNDESAFHNPNSGSKDEVSVLPAEPDHISSGLVLERFPSGRKYWSDSPKGNSGDSPNKRNRSIFSEVNHCHHAQRLIEANEGEMSTLTPDEEGNHSNDVSSVSIGDMVKKEDKEFSPHQSNRVSNRSTIDSSECSRSPTSDLHDVAIEEEREAPASTGYQSAEDQITPVMGQNGDDNTHLLDDSKTSVENEGEDVKIVLANLENLLLEQQRELQELKKKHDSVLADVLKKLPPEIHDMTLGKYGLNTLELKNDGEAGADAGLSEDAWFFFPSRRNIFSSCI